MNLKLKIENVKWRSTNRHNFQFYIFNFTLTLFLIFNFTFYIAAPPAAAQPSSPLQPGLQQEILDYPRQAAATGLGLAEASLADVDLRVFAARVAQGILMWVGILVTIFILYGGVVFMTSGGNSEKTEKAKQIISRAVIGLAIIMSSYSIVFFVTRRLVRTTFEDMSMQAYACSTRSGNATCCQEWNRFQGELGRVPNVCPPDATTFSDCGIQEFAPALQQSGERADQRYDSWRECFERETARASLPANLFGGN